MTKKVKITLLIGLILCIFNAEIVMAASIFLMLLIFLIGVTLKEHGIKILLDGGLSTLEEVTLQIHGSRLMIIGTILMKMDICL